MSNNRQHPDACCSYYTRPRLCKRYRMHRHGKQILQATSLQRATQQLASETKLQSTDRSTSTGHAVRRYNVLALIYARNDPQRTSMSWLTRPRQKTTRQPTETKQIHIDKGLSKATETTIQTVLVSFSESDTHGYSTKKSMPT